MSIHSFLIILPIALVIGVGAVLRRAGFLDERAVVAVNRLVYWVAIPALLVRLTMKASIEPLSCRCWRRTCRGSRFPTGPAA